MNIHDVSNYTSGFTATAVSPNKVSGRVVAIVRKSLLHCNSLNKFNAFSNKQIQVET